jgi:hypothetical protein
MPKDRDQLTPDEPGDAGHLRPRRSAAREAEDPLDSSTGRGPASHGSEPTASQEVDGSERGNYK